MFGRCCVVTRIHSRAGCGLQHADINHIRRRQQGVHHNSCDERGSADIGQCDLERYIQIHLFDSNEKMNNMNVQTRAGAIKRGIFTYRYRVQTRSSTASHFSALHRTHPQHHRCPMPTASSTQFKLSQAMILFCFNTRVTAEAPTHSPSIRLRSICGGELHRRVLRLQRNVCTHFLILQLCRLVFRSNDCSDTVSDN